MKLITLTNDGFGAEVRTAATIVHLCVKIVAWIVHPSSLDCLAHAVSVTLALRIALQNVITHAFDAAPGETFEIVIAYIQLSLIPVEARPRVHAAVRGTAESRLDAIIVRLAKDLLSR